MKLLNSTLGIIAAVLTCSLVSGANAVIIGNSSCGSGNYTLVPNGSFEGGITGWSNPFSKGSWASSSAEACVGNDSAISVPNQNFTGSGFAMQRTVTGLIGGDQYVLSGFFNVEGVANAEVYIDLNDILGEPNLFNSSGHQGESGWFFAHETFTAPGSSVTVRLVMDLDVLTTDVAFIDEVAITPLAQFQAAQGGNAVSEPAALGLIAAGLGLLGFARRRRR